MGNDVERLRFDIIFDVVGDFISLLSPLKFNESLFAFVDRATAPLVAGRTAAQTEG